MASGQKCNLISETLNTGYYTADFSKTAWYSGLYALVIKNSDDSSIGPNDIEIVVEIDDESSRVFKLEEKETELKNLIDSFSGVEEIAITKGEYIRDYVAVGNVVTLTPVSNYSYGYAIKNCSPNDIFTVTGYGGISPMLWAFIDSSDKLISKTVENDQRTNFVLKAPANAAKVIFNVRVAEPYAIYKGVKSANINSGNGIINLAGMGAKSGDDISALLQYVVTYAQAPCTVYLPAGTYEVSNAITWKSKISFKGDGIDQTIIKITGGTCVFSGRDISDYTMEGFTIDGTPTSGLWVKGIFQRYITRVVYRNIKIINTGATGLGTDFISDSVLENIWCDNCGASGDLNVLPDGQTTAAGCSGIGIGTVNNRYNNETINVINCFTNNCKQYGIFFENQTAQTAEGIGIKIIGCSATGNRTGIGISGNDSALVIGCTAYANHHAGFAYDSGTMIKESGDHSLSGRRVKFIGCIASYSAINIPSGYPEFRGQPNGCGFYIAHNYDGCEMIACTARKNKNHGVYIYDGITDLSIIGGTFSENDEDGIFIHGIVDKFKLHPSFIESNGAVGIEFDGQISHGTIKDIVVVGNVTGMKASASTTMTNVIIYDNLVYDNTTADLVNITQSN